MAFDIRRIKQLKRNPYVGVTYELPVIQRVPLTDANEKVGIMVRMCKDILKLEYGILDKDQTDGRFLDHHAQAHTRPYVVRETWSDGPDPVYQGIEKRQLETTKYRFFHDLPSMEDYLRNLVNRKMRKGWSA